MEIEQIIKKLNLTPLEEEGGMWRRTYTGEQLEISKPTSTAIYFLLTKDSFSHLHRLPYDEIWHFYSGDKVELLELLPDGKYITHILGSNILEGEKPQIIIDAGNWMGAKIINGGEYALLGTTMAPGYVHEDYEHGNREILSEKYPDVINLIKQMTGKPVYK